GLRPDLDRERPVGGVGEVDGEVEGAACGGGHGRGGGGRGADGDGCVAEVAGEGGGVLPRLYAAAGDDAAVGQDRDGGHVVVHLVREVVDDVAAVAEGGVERAVGEVPPHEVAARAVRQAELGPGDDDLPVGLEHEASRAVDRKS